MITTITPAHPVRNACTTHSWFGAMRNGSEPGEQCARPMMDGRMSSGFATTPQLAT